MSFAVYLRSSTSFGAFMLQGRDESDGTTAGSFDAKDINTTLSSCVPPEV